jgi:hypothetical protein
MEDGPEETADSLEESAVNRLWLNIRGRRLNHGIDMDRPLVYVFHG